MSTASGAILRLGLSLGTPDAEIDRMFVPYETAHGPGSMPESVGLGLFVTRQLVELMGGSLTYLRRNGSTVFEIHLPVVDESDGRRAQQAHQAVAR